MAALPDDIEAKIQDWSRRRIDGGESGPATGEPADTEPNLPDTAKQGLDRLIRNNGTTRP
jgi:hypothetical protein